MNNEPKRRVAMTLLAHPDDAEILCAGTLIRLADAGWEIHIATVAAGDCGSATLSREEIAAMRRQEGIAAAARSVRLTTASKNLMCKLSSTNQLSAK